MESTRTISHYIKAVIYPRGWRESIWTLAQFLLALGFLYVTGNGVQIVEEIKWAISIFLAIFFSYLFRLFKEVLTQPSITSSARNILLALFVLMIAGSFTFGFHGTTKKMDSTEIDEYRNRSHYRDNTVLVRNVVGTDGVIRNKTFEGCRIIGPAYFYVIGKIHLERSREPLNIRYLAVSDSVSPKEGAVLIDGCRFIDSWFENVTIIGHQDEIDIMKREVLTSEGALSFLAQETQEGLETLYRVALDASLTE